MGKIGFIHLKLNKPLRGHAEGVTIRVPAEGRTPTDKYWRARLKDAAIDSCVELVPRKPTKKASGGTT